MTRSNYMRRTVDHLGRLVIPADIRHRMNLEPGAAVEFFEKGDDLVIRARQLRCSTCGADAIHLRPIGKGRLCVECVEEVRNAYGRLRK